MSTRVVERVPEDQEDGFFKELETLEDQIENCLPQVHLTLILEYASKNLIIFFILA